MTEPSLPDRLEELIVGYVTQSLTPQEKQELEEFIVKNPDLEIEIERFQAAYSSLAYTTPLMSPPPHLRTSILEDASDSSFTPRLVQNPIAAKSSVKWAAIAAGIPVLLTLYVGFDGFRLRQELSALQSQISYQKDTIAMLQQSNTNLVALKGMDKAANASGNIVITAGEPKAVLVLRNLPEISKTQSYYVWAVMNDKKMPCGQFTPNPQGNVLTKLSLPKDSPIQSMVITIENSSSLTEPSGPMVMTSGV